MKIHDFAPPPYENYWLCMELFSNAHVHNSFDKLRAIGEPYCFDQVGPKVEVGQVPQFC